MWAVREEVFALGDACVVRQLSAYYAASLMYSSYEPVASILTCEALEMDKFGISSRRSFRPTEERHFTERVFQSSCAVHVSYEVCVDFRSHHLYDQLMYA
jgi:hypothetical protein